MGRKNPKLKNRTKPAPEVPVAVVLRDKCEQITLATFIKCVIDKDYTPLIVSGTPNEHQLFLAWITILSEHYTLIKSKESLKYVQTVCKMERINLKMYVVSSIVKALRMWHNEKLVGHLRDKWGYKLPFTEETMVQDLERVETELQNDNFQLLSTQKQFEAQEAKDAKKGKKPTKTDYMMILYAIESHRKQVYHPEEITLYKFDLLYNDLTEYNNAIKNTYNRR